MSVDAKGCATYVITNSVNNPQKLTLKTSGSFAAKVMVYNITERSISEQQARSVSTLYTFDLSKHKGECSITVVIYNFTSNEITVDSYLENEEQLHIELLEYDE